MIHSKDHKEDKRNNRKQNKRKNIEERHDRELRNNLLFSIKVQQLLGSLNNYKFILRKIFSYIKGVLETLQSKMQGMKHFEL